MKNVLLSLGMLLLTVAAYADGTVLFSTANGGIDVPPYRIPGITCGNGGRLIASAARLVCGTHTDSTRNSIASTITHTDADE
jgi:sialidase-1